MRYFAEIAYNGANYMGWQSQPGQPTVQETLEKALSLPLRQEMTVVGCGRTDTGVHASQYFLHFDYEGPLPENFCARLNKILPPDISFYRIFSVPETAHARYDASRRTYEYYLCWSKDPFRIGMATYSASSFSLQLEPMQEAAALLLDYEEFFPFCKSDTDVKTMLCQLMESSWRRETHQWVYRISANRFLRGMVRLIVGMCINVARGHIRLEEVRTALEQQQRLKRSESAPPQGLFLKEISYDFLTGGETTPKTGKL